MSSHPKAPTLRDPSPFIGRHHARYHREDVPYHVISRTFQGTFLLRPCPELNRLAAGVLAKALEHYGEVKLYAYAFLSNHAHLMLSGPPDLVPAFIAFVKREISRRWAPKVDWEDAMWTEYVSSALPSEASQLQCLRYILSQGVKEDLVERPEDWPGLHCAKQLTTGTAPVAVWLDATKLGKTQRLADNRRKPLDPAPFERALSLNLTPIPAWEPLSSAERLRRAKALCDGITEEGQKRRGSQVLGRRAVMSRSTRERSSIPCPPWFEERRRMVVWAAGGREEPEVVEYLAEYWRFQREFRAASLRFAAGEEDVAFPAGAFRPSVFVRRRELARPPPGVGRRVG